MSDEGGRLKRQLKSSDSLAEGGEDRKAERRKWRASRDVSGQKMELGESQAGPELDFPILEFPRLTSGPRAAQMPKGTIPLLICFIRLSYRLYASWEDLS